MASVGCHPGFDPDPPTGLGRARGSLQCTFPNKSATHDVLRAHVMRLWIFHPYI